jgi:hypothetical protein
VSVTDDALRRTVRRGIALVVVLLASVAMGLDEFVWSDYYGATPDSTFGALAFDIVPVALFVGAFVYLVGAGLRDVAKLFDAVVAPDRETEPDPGSDTETGSTAESDAGSEPQPSSD